MVIRRVGVWSVARLYGAILGAIGLLIGGIAALATLFGSSLAFMGHQSGDGATVGTSLLAAAFGLGAVIALPIFYGILGIVMGAISAALYNLFAGLFGGVEIEAS